MDDGHASRPTAPAELGPKAVRYAEVLAHLQHFPRAEQQQVLTALLGDPSQWRAVAAEGAAELSNEGARSAFARLVARTKERLAAERTPLGAIGRRRQEPVVPVPPVARHMPPSAPRPAASTAHPRLTLEQYAALRAATVVALTDAAIAAARASFGLDEASDAAEVEAWLAVFDQSPWVFEEYRARFRQLQLQSAYTGSPESSPPRSWAPVSAPAAELPRPPSPTNRPSPDSTRSAPLSSVESSTYAAALSTNVLARMLSLGKHAQLVAELASEPEETVYARYGLADREVRRAVLEICESRLKDPETLERWRRLHDMARSERRGP